MKVGVVTLHKVLNFGSVLQAYCTCTVVRRFGFEPEIINYMQPRYTVRGAVAAIVGKMFRGASTWKLPVLIVPGALKVLSYFIQRRQFEHFVKTYLPVGSGEFSSFEEISRNPPQADIYLTGSDQIWNSEYNNGVDRAHYLDFAPAGRSRISYASSFGKDKIKASDADETMNLLRKYAAIGVREFSGVQIISDLGISGASHVLDPTLLLSREEWAREFKLECPPEEAYLLIYSVERSLDKLVYATARKIADSLGLRIVFLSQAAKLGSMSGCDSQRYFADVVDFVRYFYYANFVVASSFHGTAFSVNFNRQFVSVLPPKYDARLRSLLNVVGLSARIVETEVDLETVTAPIDYSVVNAILETERKKSLAYLESNLCAAAAGVVPQ